VIFSIDSHGPRNALFDPHESRWLTYAELAARVEETARPLREFPKALVFDFCRNDVRSILIYLAFLEAGHAVALLDDHLRPELKQHLVDLYRPEFISASALAPGSLAEVCPGCWQTGAPLSGGLNEQLTLLLSTSGSTGSPKFVRLTRGNVASNARSISEALAIHEDDRAITSLPIHYSYGLSVLNTHLLCGASVVLTDEGLTASGFWAAVRDHQCTSFAGVPYSYQILNRLGLEALNVPSLHMLTQAGGKLESSLVAKFADLMHNRGGQFFVMYGQTEATARIAILPSQIVSAKLGSAGKAIPGGAISIEVEPGVPAPTGEVGELVYTGPNVMMGYANSRADLPLGDVLGGVLRTGDMASIDSDGFIYMAGRAKRDAKLYGLRINLDEVEDMLRKHGPTAVVSRDEKLRIFCEYGDDAAFAGYRRDLASRLQINYLAFEFVRVDKLPTKGSGKIDYQALLSI
jgi:acyl-CoA synthetase (AMP-forming)/AMP-acid ligase II